jgi:deoxyribose-phosphate aldolase
MVPYAVRHTAGTSVKVASVAGAFPSGQSSLEVRTADIRDAGAAGADEIDIVISRGAFLSGDYRYVFDEVEVQKEACGTAHLKVILETGELGTYVRPDSDRGNRARHVMELATAATGSGRPDRSADRPRSSGHR